MLRIRGGKPLSGTIETPGSKNCSLALLSAIILGDGVSALHNAPDIKDVHHKLHLLERLGANYNWREGSLFVDCSNIICPSEEKNFDRRTRTFFYLLGPLVARTGRALIPTPGGCEIGIRPVDFHLKGLASLGIKVELNNGHYYAHADKLRGAEIYLDFPSAGATQHIMSTACLAEGITVIHNAALEPEVVVLAEYLNLMGARIEGAGTGTITITGVQGLTACEYRVPADRLQASTYLLAGAMTQGDVTVNGILPEHLTALTNKLRESGVDVTEGHDWIRATTNERPKPIKVKTMPHPGFPTDLQQPMAASLITATGTSIVEETIYESRTGHITQLNRMGAKIHLEGRSSIIEGVDELKGASVQASDIRGGAALCLAGLIAQGETTITNVHLVDRGYENIEGYLSQLGASIERVPAESESGSKKESIKI
jgi:UDP-N-acetylglucosamine 1-carboxyvinyltransferase